ncbi:Transcription factor [Nymphaea thermarum]|nr:Transcription factor [Nymphaea thermarum]
MERLQGPIINPCIFGDNHQNVECYEGGHALDLSYGGGWGPILSTDSLRVGDRMPSMAFLQMLEGGRPPPLATLVPTEPNFSFLLALQKQQEMDARVQVMELESCITHVSETHSPVKSETREQLPPQSSNEEPGSPMTGKDGTSGSSSWKAGGPMHEATAKPPVVRERKKRKRSKPSKNSEEVESQRMTHIAVERNRRKQMNEHLNALRALMPPSYIQRGDQASIIGGAIDFVKELEQLLQSLQAQKRRRQSEEGYSPDSAVPFNGFFMSPQYTTYSSQCNSFKYLMDSYADRGGNEFTAENKSAVADIEVTLIQTHANLKVLSRRRPGQLLKAIAALEELDLAILHLNVTTVDGSVLYCFNLKIEEECKLGSADEIATAVHQIFSYINGN